MGEDVGEAGTQRILGDGSFDAATAEFHNIVKYHGPASDNPEVLEKRFPTLLGAAAPVRTGGSRASGCDNASWVVIPASETAGGERRRDRDVALDDLFAPSRRTLRVGPPHPAPGSNGPLYREFPWPAILGEAMVSVGKAHSAVDGLIRLARSKTAACNASALREEQLAQRTVGGAQARVNAARDTLRRAAEYAYDDAAPGSLLSEASPRYATAGRLLFGLENIGP